MLVAARDKSGEDLPIGLGWHLGTMDGQKYAYHLGGAAAFGQRFVCIRISDRRW